LVRVSVWMTGPALLK